MEDAKCRLCGEKYDMDAPPDPGVNQPPGEWVGLACEDLHIEAGDGVCSDCWREKVAPRAWELGREEEGDGEDE